MSIFQVLSSGVGFWFYPQILEHTKRPGRDKHPSLFARSVSNEEKSFVTSMPGPPGDRRPEGAACHSPGWKFKKLLTIIFWWNYLHPLSQKAKKASKFGLVVEHLASLWPVKTADRHSIVKNMFGFSIPYFTAFNVVDKSDWQVLTPINNSQLLLKLEILYKFRFVTKHKNTTQRTLQHFPVHTGTGETGVLMNLNHSVST